MIPDHRDIARMMQMVEQLQPNLGAFAGLNEATAASREAFAGIERMMDVTAAANRFAGIERMVEQLQPSREAFAGIERMMDVTAAGNRFAGIERMVEQLQPSREAFAGIERMMDVTAAANRFAGIERMVEQLRPNLGAFAGLNEATAASREAFAGLEGPVHAADSTDAVAPPLSPADQEDVPEGVLEAVTGELLTRLRTWCDLCDLLAGIEGLEVARLEVARQIDECLNSVARTADSDGACWGCGEATLMFSGVTCAECAVRVAQMMLATVFLAEGL